jgi:hypothetical protein
VHALAGSQAALTEGSIDADLALMHLKTELAARRIPAHTKTCADHVHGIRAALDTPVGVSVMVDGDLRDTVLEA